eukprot:scaffold132050_cov74-Attheya_sp.AAC.3
MPDELDPDYDDALHDLSSDSLITDDLSCYLTVSKAQGQSPMLVSAVLGLARYRYSAGMGGMVVYQGKVMGFLREMIGDQLPTLMMVPGTPDEHLVDLLVVVEDHKVPMVVQLEAVFAGSTPTGIMPAPNGAAELVLARRMFAPKAWVVYFMDRSEDTCPIIQDDGAVDGDPPGATAKGQSFATPRMV